MRPTRALYIAWNVADYLRNTHLYTKAIDFYKECFVLLKLTIAHGLERTIANKPRDIERQLYLGLSEAYSEIGCFENSIAMCKGCLEINKEAGNKRRQSECYEYIGRMYFNLGQCDKSLSYHEKALAIRKESKNKAMEASSYSNISIVYGTLGQYQKAIGYAEKALEIGKEIGDRASEGVAWTNISAIYFDMGQYEKAIECQEIDLKISKESGDREGEGTSYNNLGSIYSHLSQYNKSIEYFEKGLKIVQEVGYRQGEGRAFLNLSNAYMMLGDYAKSLEYNDKALPIIRSLGFRHDEGSIYLSQAGMYCTLGQYGKSVEYCQKAFEIKTRMGNKKGQASCYRILGSVYSKLGQYRISIKYSEQSLKICKEIGDLIGEGMACNNLASAYYSLGHYEKSIEYSEKDLRISKEVGDRDGEGTSYCNIGNAYFALGQYEKALECQKKALKIMKEIGSMEGERFASHSIGLSGAAMKKNLPEAVHHLSESISGHEKIRSRLKDEYKLSLDDQHIFSYRLLCHLLIDLGKPNDALCTAEQGRARGLVDLLSVKYGIQEVSDARVLHLSSIRDLFARQRTNFLFLATPVGTISLWFVNMDGKIHFYRFHKRDFHGNDLEDNLKELIENILHSLEGVQCEDRSLAAWYGTSLPIVPRRSDETAQSDHSKDKEKNQESKCHLVFNMIISPIADRIDSPEILVVPEGPLFRIPFSALQDSSGKYLSETVRIRLIPSLTTLKIILDSPADYHCQTGALVVGDPKVGPVEFNGNIVKLCPLPKAREEAQMVSRLLGVSCLVGEQATKKEVLRRIHEVSLVHIAAHGDAERGEIALAPNSSVVGVPIKDDVMLTMKDIAKVGIRAKLVVLSCCHSASGKILTAEGVVGIARAFLGSGARSVLMSLWAVDDEATKAFMDIFYKGLVREKLSASEALHHSMKALRDSLEYKDVKHWAPFVLLGDDVKLDLK